MQTFIFPQLRETLTQHLSNLNIINKHKVRELHRRHYRLALLNLRETPEGFNRKGEVFKLKIECLLQREQFWNLLECSTRSCLCVQCQLYTLYTE